MSEYKHVASVKLLDDYNKKDYWFALYDTEYDLIKDKPDTEQILAVVNPRSKNSRVLGYIGDIVTVEEYGKSVTAEVVGIVNINGFIAREAERKHKEENKKKKAAIEKEIQEEIDKQNKIQYIEFLSIKNPENKHLAELVKKYRELGE